MKKMILTLFLIQSLAALSAPLEKYECAGIDTITQKDHYKISHTPYTSVLGLGSISVELNNLIIHHKTNCMAIKDGVNEAFVECRDKMLKLFIKENSVELIYFKYDERFDAHISREGCHELPKHWPTLND